MKKIYISIATLLLCTQIMAQSTTNRNSLPVNVLTQMPAQKQADYNRLISNLATGGEEAVLTLVNMIKAPGQGSNSNVDYALSGLSHYVMTNGQESARMTVSQAYMKALEKTNERETKAFIIRQLQLIGHDECIETLAKYLGNAELNGPSARALARINTDKAGAALKEGLKKSAENSQLQMDIIEAIASAKIEGTEKLIQPFTKNEDIKFKKVVLYALSQIGSSASLKLVGDAAAKAKYTMEASGANEAYIALIKRVAAKENPGTAKKAASKLLKNATKAQMLQTRKAALQILLSLSDQKEATKLIKRALEDESKSYRNTALNFASEFANMDLYTELAKILTKATDAQKVDLLNWFGREIKRNSQIDKFNKIELGANRSFFDLLVELSNSQIYPVKEAAVWVMLKTGDKNFIPPIVKLLNSNDKQTILLAEDALLAFPGKIDEQVAKVVKTASEAGKIAALEIISNRKADAQVDLVLDQIKYGSANVKTVAYNTLKDVVVEKDIDNLCDMLESACQDEVSPIQEALIAAIQTMSMNKQVSTINQRLAKAGNKRYLYYKILATTGDPKALKTIESGFQESTGVAKDAAIDALISWNGLETAEILFNICENCKDNQTFNNVINRYIQLVSSPKLSGENRLIFLRKAMEIAKTNKQRELILKKIGNTGTFLSLLYAGQFLNDKPVQQAAARTVMNIALAHKEYAGDNVRALLMKVHDTLNDPDADYQRQNIKKHLEEMPSGKGFLPIFNGKDLSGWKGLVKNPIARSKMKPAELAREQKKADEIMKNSWSVTNGVLMFNGKGDNLCTEKKYGNFEMYIDWMLDPAGPEADAGIYLRGTPQVQIWDTSRINVGAQVGSGGLYNNQKNDSKPSKVADNKLGEWNSFYIKMKDDRVTVKLNGVKVVDNVILENYWDRKSPIFPVEQIELQAHGSRVYYRNIYVKELK